MTSTSDAHSLFVASPRKEQMEIAVNSIVGSETLFWVSEKIKSQVAPNRVDQIYRSWESSVVYGALLKIVFRFSDPNKGLRAAIKIKGEVSCFSCCDEDDMHKATDNGGAYMMNLQSRSSQIWGLRIDPNGISMSFTWNPPIEQGHKHICCVFERC